MNLYKSLWIFTVFEFHLSTDQVHSIWETAFHIQFCTHEKRLKNFICSCVYRIFHNFLWSSGKNCFQMIPLLHLDNPASAQRCKWNFKCRLRRLQSKCMFSYVENCLKSTYQWLSWVVMSHIFKTWFFKYHYNYPLSIFIVLFHIWFNNPFGKYLK